MRRSRLSSVGFGACGLLLALVILLPFLWALSASLQTELALFRPAVEMAALDVIQRRRAKSERRLHGRAPAAEHVNIDYMYCSGGNKRYADLRCQRHGDDRRFERRQYPGRV